MELYTELLEITKDNLAEAQFMASNFIDKAVQNRIFFNVVGAEAVISYLEKFGIDVSHIASIHSIKRVVEKIDIADVILDNIHIDVRVVFNENEIFIPKSHFALGIVPDIYAVLKYDKSFQRINFIGYFEASAINLNYHNDEYYFIDSDKLQSPFDMLDFIKDFKGSTEKKLSDAQFLKGRELSIAVADHDVTNDEFNEYLSLLVKSTALRSSVLEYDNFETLASRVAFALQVSKAKRGEEIETIDMDDFMNMQDDVSSDEGTDKSESDSKGAIDYDANGDSLLDDVVDTTTEIAGAATGAAIIAGAAGAVATGLSAQAASKEAIDLAAVSGEVVSDVVENIPADTNEESVEDEVNVTEDIKLDDTESVVPESEDVLSDDSEGDDLSLDGDEIPDIFDEDLADFPDLSLSEEELVSEELEPEQTSEPVDNSVSDEVSAETDTIEGIEETNLPIDVEEKENIEPEITLESEIADAEEDEEMDVSNEDIESEEFGGDLDSEILDNFITEEPLETSDSDDITLLDVEQSSDIDDIQVEQEPESEQESELEQEPELEQDIASFDAGDSLDIKDEDFSDIFEDDKDNALDFGDGSEFPTEVIEQESEDADESPENDLTSEIQEESDSENDVALEDEFSIPDDVPNDDLITEAVVEDGQLAEDISQGSLDELNVEDALSDDLAQDLDIDDNLDGVFDEELSIDDNITDNSVEDSSSIDNTEQTEEVLSFEDDGLESVDDELIIPENETHISLEDDTDKEVFTGDLESFVAPDEEFIQKVSSDLSESEAKSDAPREFDEFPTEAIAELENTKSADDYGLVNFSDLTDPNTPTPDNEEISFADIDDFASFETLSPLDEQNSEVDYTVEGTEMAIADANTVKENSFVISDKNHNPGEIFIDINKDPSKVDISIGNEHLEELYNRDALSDDSGLNNDVRVVGDKGGKSIPLALGLGGIALVVLLAGVIIFSVSKFMNPPQDEADSLVMNNNNNEQNNNLGTDVPNMNPDNGNVVMNNNPSQGSVPQSVGANQQPNAPVVGTQKPSASQPSKPIPATSFLSVRKLSWEVPDYVSTDAAFRQYFQSAGKSLKAGLSSDLLLATDYTYSDQIRLSILFSKDGAFKQARVLLSSGSSQVDNIVLQSVNQTLKVLKAPNSLGNDQSTTVILKIYL